MSLVDHGFRRPHAPLFADVLGEYDPVWAAWLSWLDPGGYIAPHTDAGPHRQRWHVPISTAGTGPSGPAIDGVPFRVEHWLPHQVDNPTDQPRVHLVIDRDVIVHPHLTPFRIEATDG